jgi:DnaJ-class molecular chaperone
MPTDAPIRFRQITAANAILRDAEQPAAYDRLLALERQQMRSKSTRIIISEAITVTVLSYCVGDRIGMDRTHFF